MVWDRDIDAKTSPTTGRPLVTGAISARTAIAFALGLEDSALAVLWGAVNPLTAGLTLGAAAFYVLVYTAWLKWSTAQNIVIGGAAGAVPTLVAWAAVTDRLGDPAWVPFGIVVLWTPPHFWALAVRHRDDYATAGVPMLPVVTGLRRVTNRILGYSVAVVAASLALGPLTGLGPLYVVGAACAEVWR